MVEAATRGKFAAFVPRTVARDAIETGHVQLLATLEPDGIAVHAIHPDGNSAALARQVAQQLVEHARKHSDS
jgi:DNA-binding transcriptional LysR family regulator